MRRQLGSCSPPLRKALQRPFEVCQVIVAKELLGRARIVCPRTCCSCPRSTPGALRSSPANVCRERCMFTPARRFARLDPPAAGVRTTIDEPSAMALASRLRAVHPGPLSPLDVEQVTVLLRQAVEIAKCRALIQANRRDDPPPKWKDALLLPLPKTVSVRRPESKSRTMIPARSDLPSPRSSRQMSARMSRSVAAVARSRVSTACGRRSGRALLHLSEPR